MLALSLVLGGGFFCGYLELGQLLDGGRRRSNINDFLVAVKASFRER